MDIPENASEIVSAEYIKGFNEGYLLAEHEPELAAKLSNIEVQSERGLGLKDGIDQMTLERERDKLPDFNVFSARNSNVEKKKNKEKGLDDFEKS